MYVWIVYAVILYIHSFSCWCVGSVLRSPLRPSAKRWDTSSAGGGKCTGVNRGKVCGKAKLQKRLSYHKVSLYLRTYTWLPLRGSWREAPERATKKTPVSGRPVHSYNFCKNEYPRRRQKNRRSGGNGGCSVPQGTQCVWFYQRFAVSL